MNTFVTDPAIKEFQQIGSRGLPKGNGGTLTSETSSILFAIHQVSTILRT